MLFIIILLIFIRFGFFEFGFFKYDKEYVFIVRDVRIFIEKNEYC